MLLPDILFIYFYFTDIVICFSLKHEEAGGELERKKKMEGTISPLCLRSSSSLSYFSSNLSLDSHRTLGFTTFVDSLRPTNLFRRSSTLRLFLSPPKGSLRTPTISAEEVRDVPMPKVDKSGRLSSPRAARELALYVSPLSLSIWF